MTKNLLVPYSAAPGTGGEQTHTKSSPSSPQWAPGPPAAPNSITTHTVALHPEKGAQESPHSDGGKEGFHPKENVKSFSPPGSSPLTRKRSGAEGSAPLSPFLSLTHTHMHTHLAHKPRDTSRRAPWSSCYPHISVTVICTHTCSCPSKPSYGETE